MVSWNFPGNQDGQIKGIADAGIENFNGTELSSLARENCQNSLDAALDDDNLDVVVEFERYFLPTNQIPGIVEYRNILKKCKMFWDRSGSEKAKLFLKDAIKELEKENTFVLRISDYNTSGLSDPYTQSNDPFNFSFDGWNALIKIDGGANKGDDKAGAFGIGKSAPFSNSYYRLIFYRTYNQKYERAAQGISRLMSYQNGALMTSGIGYYGEAEGNNPVEAIPELDSINKRLKIGTDVFIYGFKSTSNWETEITVALLENFLISFYYGQLRVKVQGREINKKSLSRYVERIHRERPGATKGTYGNYLALTRKEGVHTYSKNFHGMGTLELSVLVDPNEKLDRKVLIVRKAGMKLFRLNPLLVRRQKGRYRLEGLQGAARHENQRTRLLSDPQRGETAWHSRRHAVRRPQHGGPDRHELQPNIHADRLTARPHPRHRENRHGHTHRRRNRLLDAQQPRPGREPERGHAEHAMAAMVRQSHHPTARIREQRETRPDLQRRHVPSRHVRRKRRLSGRRHRRHPERRQPVHSRRNTAHRQTGRANQRGRQH